ncbi:MAG TPA: hypothetical protein VGR28_00750 [Candidatus Thermoplasmatota archaeon]|jgi:hypothetical protein|nr:hypothetical protein [Candidatus Thermoplasmatota archaeon]
MTLARAKVTLGLAAIGASLVVGAILFIFIAGAAGNLGRGADRAAESAASGLTPAVAARGLTAHGAPDGSGLDELRVLLALAPGVPELPLPSLAVQVIAAGDERTFTLGDPPLGYGWSALLDQSPEIDPAAPALSPGDVVELRVETGAAGLAIPLRSEGSVLLLSAHYRAERVPFRVPASLGGQDLWDIDPAFGTVSFATAALVPAMPTSARGSPAPRAHRADLRDSAPRSSDPASSNQPVNPRRPAAEQRAHPRSPRSQHEHPRPWQTRQA